MAKALEAAAALHRIVFKDSGESLSRARTFGILFYAQGISLAIRGEPLFEGSFRTTGYGFSVIELEEAFGSPYGPWWVSLEREGPSSLDADPVLRDVARVFGALNAQALAEAIRAEAPWRTATEDGGPDGRDVPRVDIHDHFAEMLEDGKDVISELGLPLYPGRPEWEQPFRVAVNVKCLAGHPMFNEVESRDLRRRLDLEDLPDSWRHDAEPVPAGDGILHAAAAS